MIIFVEVFEYLNRLFTRLCARYVALGNCSIVMRLIAQIALWFAAQIVFSFIAVISSL